MSNVDRSKKTSSNSMWTKLVVRRLPPNFTLQSFQQHFGTLPKHNHLYFVGGSKVDVNLAFSRAYVSFARQEDVFFFKEKFDSYVFLDTKGNEYPAVVEFAPYRVTPTQPMPQKDPLCSTIQFDEYYIQFVNNLKKEEKAVKRADFDFQLENHPTAVTLTPLLKYINDRKCEKIRAGKDVKMQKGLKKKSRDNCIIFVNSAVKKSHYKYGGRFNKKKQIFPDTFV